jgi:hypothetical protein
MIGFHADVFARVAVASFLAEGSPLPAAAKHNHYEAITRRHHDNGSAEAVLGAEPVELEDRSGLQRSVDRHERAMKMRKNASVLCE